MKNWHERCAREEGGAAQHGGLQLAAGRVQEQLHILAAGKLRDARVQLGAHHHRALQAWVRLQSVTNRLEQV